MNTLQEQLKIHIENSKKSSGIPTHIVLSEDCFKGAMKQVGCSDEEIENIMANIEEEKDE